MVWKHARGGLEAGEGGYVEWAVPGLGGSDEL